MKTLLLLRHAKSAWSDARLADHDQTAADEADVDPGTGAGETPDEWTWLPREELQARIDRTIGAALAAAAALGR